MFNEATESRNINNLGRFNALGIESPLKDPLPIKIGGGGLRK